MMANDIEPFPKVEAMRAEALHARIQEKSGASGFPSPTGKVDAISASVVISWIKARLSKRKRIPTMK
jgi:hypothetical protein